MSEIDPPLQRVSMIELTRTFSRIAVASFGGGLSAWSRQVVVEEKGWLTDEEFLSAMTMCRILPGANQVNMAVYVGTKMRGLGGAASALFGLCLLPVAFTLAAGYAYFRFKEVPAVDGALHGASTAAVALTLTMVIKTGQKCLTGAIPVVFFAASFVMNGLLRWPLLQSLAILAPLSLIWAWPRKART